MNPNDNRKLASAVLAGLAAALFSCARGLAQTPVASKPASGASWGTPCDAKPHANDIDVGTKVGCKLALASRGNAAHIVRWQSVDPKMNVKIVFDWPNPFLHMTNCDGTNRMCKADTPGAPGDPGKLYPYTASLCDANGVCNVVSDPGIIIVP